MDQVHIFCARGKFPDDQRLSRFVTPTYSEDGELIPSQFMREIGLIDNYDPTAIESERFDRPLELLAAIIGFSYSDQFRVVRVDPTLVDTVICVYSPNAPQTPQRSTLDYVGVFSYNAENG